MQRMRSQFLYPHYHNISELTKELIQKALLEGLSLRGICRLFSVSSSWLLEFMIKVFNQTPDALGIKIETLLDDDLQVVVIQVDEAWSFVFNKANNCWIWVAYERNSKQVIAFHIGDRSKQFAKLFYQKIPASLRKKYLLFFTDDLQSYNGVISSEKHQGDKKFKQDIERLFCTMRYRVSRVARRNLACSKSWENHELALKFFSGITILNEPYIKRKPEAKNLRLTRSKIAFAIFTIKSTFAYLR